MPRTDEYGVDVDCMMCHIKRKCARQKRWEQRAARKARFASPVASEHAYNTRSKQPVAE